MRPMRNRVRRASSGLPGYDNLGWDSFGHPASLAQPEVDEYGIDSEFGEGVRKGPYRSGPAPASYGWQPDHPAAKESLLEDYEETEQLYDANIKKAMERKASKCIAIAESRLGKYASQQEIEDLALRYMDIPSRTINAKFSRVASTFLAEDVVQEETGYAGGDVGPGNMMADEFDDMGDEFDDMDDEGSSLMADSDLQAHSIHDEYDMDDDGLISREEWGGASGVFDALDTNMDGFIDDEEATMGLGAPFAGVEMDDEDDFDMDDEVVSPAMNLAEEINNLKKANVRLARQIRKFAEDAVQEATGYVGVDESVDVLDMEEDEGPAPRLASSNRIATRLAALSAMAEEAQSEGDNEAVAEILAEINDVTAGIRRNPYGESIPTWGGIYQDPDVRWKHQRRIPSGMPQWDAMTKQMHNKDYYQANKHLWAEYRKNRRQRRLMERGLPMDFEGRMPRMPRNTRGNRFADEELGFDEGFADEQFGFDEGFGDEHDEGVTAMEEGAFADLLAEMDDMETGHTASGWSVQPRQAEEGLSEEESSMLAEMIRELEAEEEPVTPKKASSKKNPAISLKAALKARRAADEEAEEEEEDDGEDEEPVASKKASSKKNSAISLKAALKARRAAEKEEEEEEEEDDDDKEADTMGLNGKTAKIDPKLARIFAAADEEAEEDGGHEVEGDILMAEEEPEVPKKSASVKTRQASVKTLGNLSREASSSSDELSKLWESAPDVSKYFS